VGPAADSRTDAMRYLMKERGWSQEEYEDHRDEVRRAYAAAE
jgi:hypothetical protein